MTTSPDINIIFRSKYDEYIYGLSSASHVTVSIRLNEIGIIKKDIGN